jgi:hypothetical protein
MKYLLLLSLAVVFGCSSAKQDVKTPTQEAKTQLREFTEGNFGVTFNHSENITTEYNPHGGADRVDIFRNGTFIGGLRVLPPFPTNNEWLFLASGRAYYLQDLRASSVEHRRYQNPRGYRFDVFQARLTRGEVEHLTERYMYRRQRVAKDEVQAALDAVSGVFQFEFIAPAHEYPAIQEDIKVIVETFRLQEPETE